MTSPQPPVDGRLGRIFVGYDERNRGYGVRELLPPREAVQRKPTFWAMPDGPFPLDQGPNGACTGFGMAQELAAGPVMFPNIDNDYAMARYRRNQEEDRKMGLNFPDGATVLGTMKASKADNLITGYRWCFGVDDVVDTVCSTGPVCLGIDWLNNMFDTSPEGRVNVSGPVAGGHFIDLIAYDEHPSWGPVVGWLNSWGFGYGVAEPRLNLHKGIGWLTLPDLASLLSRDGEAVVPADFFAVKPTKAPYFAASKSAAVFHDVHPGLRRVQEFQTYADAQAAGLRPCRICRPKP
jgi:hypothetical protein